MLRSVRRRARIRLRHGDPYRKGSYPPRVDPDDVDLLILRGNLLDTMNRFEEAARLYRRVLRLDPDNPLALVDLADSYACAREEHRNALRYYDRALRALERGRFHANAAEEFVEACVGKAETLLDLDRPLDALRTVLGGLARYPTDLELGGVLQRAQAAYQALLARQAGQQRKARAVPGRGRTKPAARGTVQPVRAGRR